jgi:AcrR family transcriptional regulator
MISDKQPVKRKRGRPPKKAAKEKPLHDVIVEAVRQVCCDHSVHGLTVELILRQAGISRPTFYKFFRNKEEVLDLVSKEVNQKLVNAITREFQKQNPKDLNFITVIDAYLDWGMGEGAIVDRLYQAVKDETSIPSMNRKNTVKQVIKVIQEAVVSSGRAEQDTLLLDALINTFEYLCNPLFTKKHTKKHFNRVRNIILDSLEKLIIK